MKGWKWLRGYAYNWRFVVRVLIKAFVLFLASNLTFAISNPLPIIGQISIYNRLVPGRDRLPYGESGEAYNLSLNNLEAMFSSHKVAQPKPNDEYRVIVVGDSSVWGVLLDNKDTLTENLNKDELRVGNKQVKAYNIGHPIMSATKDLMLMDYALRYQPDMIVWLVTLESLAYSKQLDAPLVQNNAALIRPLIERFQLNLDANDTRLVEPDLWGRTIIGQRRALADWWRLQLYGINWAATGIDQIYGDYKPRANDFEADTNWHGFTQDAGLEQSDIAFDVLKAGPQLVGSIPMLIINEPIYLADGVNSDHRYNFWYSTWAYDRYRDLLAQLAYSENWNYVDLWDRIASEHFTDSPVHLTANGSQQLSILVGAGISGALNNKR